ncbi:unnamed protein product [Amoebophrya sp. A120]|nr:unnamed protein product [Amoebophrya sp. A120]|eukprot:GSA120T00016115001.1
MGTARPAPLQEATAIGGHRRGARGRRGPPAVSVHGHGDRGGRHLQGVWRRPKRSVTREARRAGVLWCGILHRSGPAAAIALHSDALARTCALMSYVRNMGDVGDGKSASIRPRRPRFAGPPRERAARACREVSSQRGPACGVLYFARQRPRGSVAIWGGRGATRLPTGPTGPVAASFAGAPAVAPSAAALALAAPRPCAETQSPSRRRHDCAFLPCAAALLRPLQCYRPHPPS